MNQRKAIPLLLAFGLLLAAAGFTYVRPEAAPAASSLSGQFLVASRQMPDPNFARTVIYMVEHSEKGAMGLVVNRVLGSGTLQALLGGFGIETDDQRRVDLHYGGPVQANRGFVLHSEDYSGESTQVLAKGLALSTGLGVMQAMAEGRGPKQVRILLGYTGWSAGQLERELSRNDWLVAPADVSLIFSSNPDSVWEDALQRAGILI